MKGFFLPSSFSFFQFCDKAVVKMYEKLQKRASSVGNAIISSGPSLDQDGVFDQENNFASNDTLRSRDGQYNRLKEIIPINKSNNFDVNKTKFNMVDYMMM